MNGCELCERADQHGWWGRSEVTHCRGRHRTWSRTSREAHCEVCHRHFGGPSTFDAHLSGPPQKPAVHDDPAAKTRIYRQDVSGTWREDVGTRFSAGARGI